MLVLNKELCWRCVVKTARVNKYEFYEASESSFRMYFDKNWTRGEVYCETLKRWRYFYYKSDEDLTKDCPYFLEHVIGQ
jgi:hypothetical protein